MGPLILFAVGRIVFSLIRKDIKFWRLLLYEFLASFIFIALGIALLNTGQVMLRSVLIGTLLLITGLAPRFIYTYKENKEKSRKQPLVTIIDFV